MILCVNKFRPITLIILLTIISGICPLNSFGACPQDTLRPMATEEKKWRKKNSDEMEFEARIALEMQSPPLFDEKYLEGMPHLLRMAVRDLYFSRNVLFVTGKPDLDFIDGLIDASFEFKDRSSAGWWMARKAAHLIKQNHANGIPIDETIPEVSRQLKAAIYSLAAPGEYSAPDSEIMETALDLFEKPGNIAKLIKMMYDIYDQVPKPSILRPLVTGEAALTQI